MKQENLIHVKLNHRELILSKREILQTEMNLLKILQTIKRYKKLRLEELETKLEIQKKHRAIKREISSIETDFPKIKIPKILKEKHKEIEPKPKSKKTKTQPRKYNDEIEQELQEIQKKLTRLH